MAIYTSRYSNKQLKDGGYYPVGISLGKPKFSTGYTIREQCYALAPERSTLNFEYHPYREAYFRKLNSAGVERIIGIVRRLDMAAAAEGKQLVLLCFEDIRKPGAWCHRTLFAEWWEEHTGEMVQELEVEHLGATPPKSEEHATKIEQMSLF